VSLAGFGHPGALGALLHRPALATVPLAFLVMVVGRRRPAKPRPGGPEQVMLRLHAPERLGLSRDRLNERPRRTTI
jgi:hypothetical protein